MQQQKKKMGLTSIEAAALYLSDGATTDPEEAAIINSSRTLDMDALQKAGLRRTMGFDFEIKQRPNKMFVTSKEGPVVRTHAKLKPDDIDKYGNIINEDAINRLVDACIRLKIKWDAEVAKDAVRN